MLIFDYQDGNDLTPVGCQHLSFLSNWKIKSLNLSNSGKNKAGTHK